MAEIRLMSDWVDAWGSTLQWHFAICEVLTAAGWDVPAKWEFHQGPISRGESIYDVARGDEYPDAALAESVIHNDYTPDDLLYAGEVLHRYASVLRRAGVSY
jgi:hypothetical protein